MDKKGQRMSWALKTVITIRHFPHFFTYKSFSRDVYLGPRHSTNSTGQSKQPWVVNVELNP